MCVYADMHMHISIVDQYQKIVIRNVNYALRTLNINNIKLIGYFK